MQIKDLTPDFAATGQITAADMPEIAARGVTLIVANRPDHEEPGQPTFAEIAEAARAHGIEAVHVPVTGVGAQSEADVAKENAALAGAKGPVLAYCKAGGRAEAMWRATGRG